MTHRLFAGPAGTLLVPRTDFTLVERNALDEIIAYARDSANGDNELGICLDLAGRVEFDRSQGRHKAADFTQVMRDRIEQSSGGRFWHNHPSQTSLSDTDWLATSSSENLEILAINRSGSVFVGRMRAWCEEYEPLMQSFRKIAGDLEFKLDREAKQAGLHMDDIVQLSRLGGHVMNIAMRRVGVVDYAASLSPEDEALYHRFDEAGVIEAGVTFGMAEISSELPGHD